MYFSDTLKRKKIVFYDATIKMNSILWNKRVFFEATIKIKKIME